MASVQDGRSSQTTRSSNENYMFDGNSGNFYSWVNKFEARQPRSTKQVEFLRPLLAGKAGEVYDQLNDDVKYDYDRARRALVDKYPPNAYEAYTEIMSRVRRPTEPIRSYCEDLRMLIRYSTPSLEQESPNSYIALLKSAFFAGLSEHSRRQFESQPISSMDQMQEIISRLDSNNSIDGEDTEKMATTVDLPYGVKFNKQYTVSHKLGEGRFGTVCRAFNVSDKAWYAVKEIQVKDMEFDEKEAQRHQKLIHHGVVKYYHSFRDTKPYKPSNDNGPTEGNRSSQAATRLSSTPSLPMEVSDSNSSNPQDKSGVRVTSSTHMQVVDSTSRGNPGEEKLPPSSGIVSVLYIVMELCDMSLEQYVKEHKDLRDKDHDGKDRRSTASSDSCVMTLKQHVEYHKNHHDRWALWTAVRHLLMALKHLKDNNIAHNDIHEGNILLKLKQPDTGARDLSAYDIKLSDFGAFSTPKNKSVLQDDQYTDLDRVGRLAHSLLIDLVIRVSDVESAEYEKMTPDEKEKCAEYENMTREEQRKYKFKFGTYQSEKRIIKKMRSSQAEPADVLADLNNLVCPEKQPTQRVTTKL